MNQIQASLTHMGTKIVYTVTVIDLRSNLPLGVRRTPVICTELEIGRAHV